MKSKSERPAAAGGASLEEPIAIIAADGVFPGSSSIDEFWKVIHSARDTTREVPPGRWILEPNQVLDSTPGAADRVYTARGCFLEPFKTSADGLNLSPERLEALDPVVHVLLEACRRSLASVRLDALDRRRIGVIVGNIALPTDTSSELCDRILSPVLRPQSGTASAEPKPLGLKAVNRFVSGLPAGLVAEAFGFGGGTCTLDAACASSLYALKLACDELTSGRADAMLAGGVSRPDSLYTQMGFSQLRALSPSGRCSPFDAAGDGLVVGEGAGIVVLRRLSDALDRGEPILAVIKGIGLSNDLDGNLLSPNSEGQLRALRQAYRAAAWSPDDVDFIECHATGTPVGDAVEFESLCRLWEGRPWNPGQCVLGAVKANIGHLLTGAGSASLVKVILALKHRTLPPTANFRSPSDRVPLHDSPFRILETPQPWVPRGPQVPRRAAINGFGFGGINAHVLVEEWIAPPIPSSLPPAPNRTKTTPPAPIAVVGLSAMAGPWTTLTDFQERVLGSRKGEPTEARPDWRGVTSGELERVPGGICRFPGYYLPDLSIPMNRYRIPPKELAELLPQQALMLESARLAIEDAQLTSVDPSRTGVFIGLSLDLRTTDFHLRWASLKPSSPEVQGLGQTLTADRTMGALAGVNASRIAKEFQFGGPTHTVCNEDCSGIRALEIAVRALQRGEIDRAIAGAVDITGDLRTLVATHAVRPYSTSGETKPFDASSLGSIPGEGAAAVVLKRLDDAQRDGDRVYAVIRGIGSSSGSPLDGPGGAHACTEALSRAYDQAQVSPLTIGYLETHGSGVPEEDQHETEAIAGFFVSQASVGDFAPPPPCYLGSVKADVGHAGAASGLLGFTKACLALFHQVIPPLRGGNDPIPALRQHPRLRLPRTALPWIRDQIDGPRRAGISCASVDGNHTHVVLEEPPEPSDRRRSIERPWSFGEGDETLFLMEGETRTELTEQLVLLREMVDSRPDLPFKNLGRHWFDRVGNSKRSRRLVVIAQDIAQLRRLLHAALETSLRDPLRNDPPAPVPRAQDRDRIFYATSNPFADSPIGFVYPGAGNQFVGMGRELALRWPSILRKQDLENQRLASQMYAHTIWNESFSSSVGLDHRAVICGQVTLGAFTTDLVRSFGVEPDVAIGYSLGESTALFALRAWVDRDDMFERVSASTLFSQDLTGSPEQLRQAWQWTDPSDPVWKAGLVDRSADLVRRAIGERRRVYILIINTPSECVIGGETKEVGEVLEALGCHWFPLDGVSTVHCALLRPFEQPYRELHRFETHPPEGVRFLSGGWGREFVPDQETAAEAIVAQASDTIDFPRVIHAAYESGVRVFLEMGPGASCTRMIDLILGDRPHLARSLCPSATDSVLGVLRVLAHLTAEGVPVDLRSLYTRRVDSEDPSTSTSPKTIPSVRIPITGPPLVLAVSTRPSTPANAGVLPASVPVGPIPSQPGVTRPQPVSSPEPILTRQSSAPIPSAQDPFELLLARAMTSAQSATMAAHEAYLRFSQGLAGTLSRSIETHLGSPSLIPSEPTSSLQHSHDGASTSDRTLSPTPSQAPALNRDACLEFARGSVGRVLGEAFSEVDSFPTRVRLPDEPLMLVDRITEIEAEPRSMSHGRLVTEHDIHPGAWYLDCGCIPTCIAVEAGQADLFLSGYLGIDFITRGLAMYRLLDAKVCFHRGLPGPGSIIRYDIHIDHFFRQGSTWLFRFHFEATVNGEPLLSMSEGCAGFFSQAELANGKGIVRTTMDQRLLPGKRTERWRDFVSMSVESYSEAQLEALRAGQLATCFGAAFQGLCLKQPLTLPSGRMRLVHRIPHLDPNGGRFGMGLVRGEADIHPSDWFLTCHFVDDRVMPGTLMFECCLHTLRVFLLRLGWVVESDAVALEPVPGVASQLKCRGQVLESTRVVTYEITIKEIGFRPEPYVIADALMYADGKAIVEINHMSLRYRGVDLEMLSHVWSSASDRSAEVSASAPATTPQRRPALYDYDRILAFAVGKPSVAFGAPYTIFDSERRIARLPGPPYQFLDRVVEVTGEPFKMVPGGSVVAEYDVPPGEWYFAANRQPDMPFAVLLEIALQPCGWLAAYVGSALTSQQDLSFRNLGGTGTQFCPVYASAGTLTICVKMTRASSSAGMIIQWFDFEVLQGATRVYKGDTYFGFFPQSALARQEGIQGAKLFQPPPESSLVESRGPQPFPVQPPFPSQQLSMVDQIELFLPHGGPSQLGFIRGTKKVNPEEWFFKAHFYQDPVVPGSLGLESFLQLLKFMAIERWGHQPGTRWEAVAMNTSHEWVYRGQIVPKNNLVSVEASVVQIDDTLKSMTAEGFLSVDGRVIYGMKQFTVRQQLLET